MNSHTKSQAFRRRRCLPGAASASLPASAGSACSAPPAFFLPDCLVLRCDVAGAASVVCASGAAVELSGAVHTKLEIRPQTSMILDVQAGRQQWCAEAARPAELEWSSAARGRLIRTHTKAATPPHMLLYSGVLASSIFCLQALATNTDSATPKRV